MDLHRITTISRVTDGSIDISHCSTYASKAFIYPQALNFTFDYEWKNITKRRFIIWGLIESRIKFYPITLTPG